MLCIEGSKFIAKDFSNASNVSDCESNRDMLMKNKKDTERARVG
ncbi:MAG: hypothetical protein VYB18_04930 [Thermodesulfobacteriota bacterium]|nr:hypothetical protein [Thermodesulfobacteriota bacterium]